MPAGMVRATSCSQSRQASILTISMRWCSTAPSGSPRADWRGWSARGWAAFALGRGLVRPLGAICGVMDGLAKGDLSVEVPFVEHRNEIGHISRSLAVFKDRLVDAERLRAEREEATARALAERKSAMNRIASEFEKSVGGIVAGAASAATEMQRSAQSLSAIAKETTRQSTSVAAAAQQTTQNVQTVATAAEELSTSGHEISRQI